MTFSADRERYFLKMDLLTQKRQRNGHPRVVTIEVIFPFAKNVTPAICRFP